MLKVTQLTKSFGDQAVLKGIDLTVNRGEICALIGSSGRGKSVLLKHIIGLLKPDEGHVHIDGKDIHSLRGQRLRELKERCGIVFQGGALFDSLNVFENVAFPLQEKTKLRSEEIREAVLEQLTDVGLSDALDKHPSQLSGGMKKRVALARCLVTKPEVILFDEPTTGLDPMTSKTIHKLIRETQQKRNLTAIIVSHEIPTVFSIVDRVAMLHNGEIIIHTTPDEFQKSENTIVQQFLHGELE